MLILIIITIASAVIVYSYVMGYVGNSEAGPTGVSSIFTIEDFCVSAASFQCNSNAYSIVIDNSGSSVIPSGTVELYFSDLTQGTSAAATCQLAASINPGSTFTCPSGSGVGLPAALNAAPGDVVSIQAVTPDGSRGTSSTKILTSQLTYVPITLTNSQSAATQDDLQVLINVDFNSYAYFLASNVGNIRFYNSTNFVIANELPAWLENYTGGSGTPSTATTSDVWVKLAGTLIPANSYTTIYMLFESVGTTFDGVYWGEAPQLSSTYGEYDNGANVFLYYNVAPESLYGWTIVGSAGLVSTAPTGSYFKTAQAYYAYSANGDYLYSEVPGFASNEIVTFWTYTTGLGNVYYLASAAGAGQMARLDSRGGGDYSGLATTTKWTSWTAPGSGLDETKDLWYKYDIVINGATATSYIGSTTNNLGTLGTQANTLAVSNDGTYMGLIGDALGASYISYWNGLIIRYMPPSDVAPSVNFGSLS
jgi:hypothetical protein